MGWGKYLMLAAGVGAVGYFAYKYLFGKNESGQDPDIDEIMETAEEEDRIHEAKLKEPFPCCIDKHHPQHSSGNQPSASAGPSASSSAKLKKRRDTFGGFEPGFLLKK